jgi:hypothetical protein
MTLSAGQWTELFATKLGTAPPSDEETNLLLALAGTAAHASERTAAPISCWLAARAGVNPGEAARLAKVLADEMGEET